MIKSRAQLKKSFENGSMPDGTCFANLIDSMVAEPEYAAFVAATNAALAQRNCDLGDFPQVPQWIGIGGRIGLYNPAGATTAKMPSAAALTTLSVAADGNWHPIIPNLNGCYAFEVVASVSDAANTANSALTHATALTSFSGSACSIRQTQAYGCWPFCRRISFCWIKSGDKTSGYAYSLNVKTRRNYGNGSDGKPIPIQYHISRLW
jgi:hypothetical protein